MAQAKMITVPGDFKNVWEALGIERPSDEELAAARKIERAELVDALRAAVRAANLALFVIRKQGVMPNSSWESGFKADIAKAEAVLDAALATPPVKKEG